MARDMLAIARVPRRSDRYQCRGLYQWPLLSQMNWECESFLILIMLLSFLSGFAATGSVDSRRDWQVWAGYIADAA